jgi:glycosyltransferase involved in cell wall biosynthesis
MVSMRVLLFEQEYRGHYLSYLGHLIPSLSDLVDEVIVAITSRAHDSTEFRAYLAPLADRADFHPVVPLTDSSLRLSSRGRLLDNLRRAVRTFRPDYVLVPSGDGQTSFMGLYSILTGKGLPGGVPGEVGIHYGYGPVGAGFKNGLKDIFYTQTQRLSSWRKIHYASSIFYEWIRSRGGSLAMRAELLPDPVPSNPRIGKSESRRRLGIPEDGRYIGLAAELDRRKGIDRLLAAFRSAAGPQDRMLLAGRLDPEFTKLIESEYRDMVERDRILLMNHYVDRPTANLVFDALDVVCVPHPRHGPLSATMLHGLAAARPVLTNDFGWMASMVRRFECGSSCDVLDPEAYSRTIRSALDQCEGYRESEATRRLLEFHAPENFAASWLAGIRNSMGLPGCNGRKPWSWVLDALDQEHRTLM